MSSRSQRTTLPMLPGDDPGFMPAGLHPEQETSHLCVPEFVRAVFRLGCRGEAFGEGGD